MLDQSELFTATGASWVRNMQAADPERPVRIMLAWTDAKGHGLGGSTPAWVNDLDLSVAPTVQQVNHLTYVQQILNESLIARLGIARRLVDEAITREREEVVRTGREPLQQTSRQGLRLSVLGLGSSTCVLPRRMRVCQTPMPWAPPPCFLRHCAMAAPSVRPVSSSA